MGLVDWVTPVGTGGRTTGFWDQSSTPVLGALSSTPATASAVMIARLGDILTFRSPEGFARGHEFDGDLGDESFEPARAFGHAAFFGHIVAQDDHPFFLASE